MISVWPLAAINKENTVPSKTETASTAP